MKKNRLQNEAVICLSHDLSNNLNLTNEYKRRIHKSYKILKKTNSKYMVFTGGILENRSILPLSEHAYIYLKKNFSVKNIDILKESKSRDTIGDAIFSLKKIEHKKISVVHIITSDWHITRTKRIFKKIYGHRYQIKFYKTEGFKKYANNEIKNRSYIDFLRWSNKCNAGDIGCLKSELRKHHRLYRY